MTEADERGWFEAAVGYVRAMRARHKADAEHLRSLLLEELRLRAEGHDQVVRLPRIPVGKEPDTHLSNSLYHDILRHVPSDVLEATYRQYENAACLLATQQGLEEVTALAQLARLAPYVEIRRGRAQLLASFKAEDFGGIPEARLRASALQAHAAGWGVRTILYQVGTKPSFHVLAEVEGPIDILLLQLLPPSDEARRMLAPLAKTRRGLFAVDGGRQADGA